MSDSTSVYEFLRRLRKAGFYASESAVMNSLYALMQANAPYMDTDTLITLYKRIKSYRVREVIRKELSKRYMEMCIGANPA
ncbi:MAG: hypothetical protein QW320_06555 [Ignisphaera sp.]|uniref:hypothetical protein n=1 Tax=Thermofilum sp. TaxID=1961369 RepID=UPI003160D7FC